MEPPSGTTVVFDTRKGRLEVCLWTKEFAASRKFLEKCFDGRSEPFVFSSVEREGVIVAARAAPTYDLQLETHPHIKPTQRGYVCAAQDELTGNYSIDRIVITTEPITTQTKKHLVLGKLTPQTFYTIRDIAGTEISSENETKLAFSVVATPVSVDGVEISRREKEETKASEPKPKKAKRKVVLGYDEEDAEVKRVKMKLAHETLGGPKKLIKDKDADSEEAKELVDASHGGIKRENKGEVETGKTTNSNDKSYERKETGDENEEKQSETVTSESLHASTDHPQELVPRRHSFVYNASLDFEASDAVPPPNLSTHKLHFT